MSIANDYYNWATVPGVIGQFMGTPPNAADSGMPYLNNIEGDTGKYLNPYIQGGQQAYGTLQQQYGQLLNDPTGIMNKIGKTYQQSPGYQWQVNQALGAANRASAAGGMAGSPQEQQNIAGTVNQMANQDYYNYVNHGLGLYQQGLQGEGGLNQMGFGASGQMADYLGNRDEEQAQLAYAGQANQNQAQQGQQGAILGGIGSALGGIL